VKIVVVWPFVTLAAWTLTAPVAPAVIVKRMTSGAGVVATVCVAVAVKVLMAVMRW
jgi:hypothetical protein